MKPDAGLQATRDVRERISRELGNNPRRLIEYYMAYQRRFAQRLRIAPGADEVHGEDAEESDAADRPTASR